MLIDGVRVNDPTNSRGGSFDVSTVQPEAVERVEVVRGSRSAVLGSAALAGAVNIVTRTGTASPQLGGSAAIGTDGFRRAAATATGTVGGVRTAVTAGFTDHGEPVEGSGLLVRHATAKAEFPIGGMGDGAVFARWADVDAESFPDDSGGPRFAVLRGSERREIREVSGGATLDRRVSGDWTLAVRTDGYGREEDVTSPGVAPGLRDPFGIPASRFDTSYRRYSVAVAGAWQPEGTTRAALGAELGHETGESRSTLVFPGFELPGRFDLERSLVSVFAEGDWRPAERLTLSGAIRLDEPDGFDGEVSPMLSASYTLGGTGPTLFASWAEGFKLPSFFGLGNPVVGNPDLLPEGSESWEVGVRGRLCGGFCTLELAAFHTRYDNLVDFDPGPPPRLVNRTAAVSRGVELSLDWAPADTLAVTAHATYVDALLLGTDAPLRSRPDWTAGVQARYQPARNWELFAGLTYVGRFVDSSIPTGDFVLGDNVALEAAVAWRPVDRLNLHLAVDNLLDADFAEAVGRPAPGRAVRFSVDVRL